MSAAQKTLPGYHALGLKPIENNIELFVARVVSFIITGAPLYKVGPTNSINNI